MVKKIVTVILILLILFTVGYAVYGIMNGQALSELLPRAVIIICGALGTLFKMKGKDVRRPLSFYESQYPAQLKNAFVNDKASRKKLLCAIRLYNEDRFGKAINKLIKLTQKCNTAEDIYAVYIFLGLIFTDADMYPEAVHAYQVIIDRGVADGEVYNNLGYVYTVTKDSENAIANYRQALRYDPKNAQAYHNIASIYFDNYCFDEAIEYSNKALECAPNMRHTLALLAIIYSKIDNDEEADKYFHMAVAQGHNAESLRAAIKRYAALSEEDWNKENE